MEFNIERNLQPNNYYRRENMIIMKVLGILLVLAVVLFFIIENGKMVEETIKEEDSDYEVPRLKELTQEQIEDIHARGKKTPEEQIREWEELSLCAPGDAIGSVAWRCHKFKNCHDCLVDYASTQDEYTSVYDEIKIICK